MANIILGITGSIAAFKSAELVSKLTYQKHKVQVVITESGRKFIPTLTLQTLSKNEVYSDIFQDKSLEVKHISLAEQSDMLVIVPATANIITKIALGIADDMLTCIALAMWEKPIVIAPAMNTKMYMNPIIQESISVLKKRGCIIVEPKESMLACGTYGKGALADIAIINDAVVNEINKSKL